MDKTSIKRKIELTKESYQKLLEVFNAIEIGLDGKKIVEIGSGWLPIMPYFLKYFSKCQEVLTYDIREHYSSVKISQFNKIFFSEFMNQLIPEIADKRYNLPAGIKYYPSTDFINVPLPENSVDLIVSRFVLEHISFEDLLNIHIAAKKCLKKNGAIAHLIGASDHRAHAAHTDKSLSLYDFLKYSQKEWERIQTRFDYHNRLRMPQYEEIFKKAGFSIAYKFYSCAQNNDLFLKEFKKVNIHSDYKQFNVDEISACLLVFGLKREKR
ncbi:MAG: class I SAM-dependent methyltransferase [Omnitrophica bacterium]|nr:class I SAM-dependent methyltransferase [Candidatus Omnitrophota bacterium]